MNDLTKTALFAIYLPWSATSYFVTHSGLHSMSGLRPKAAVTRGEMLWDYGNEIGTWAPLLLAPALIVGFDLFGLWGGINMTALYVAAGIHCIAGISYGMSRGANAFLMNHQHIDL